MRDLNPTWDGDQPLYRIRVDDDGAWRDLSSAAVVFNFQDEDGNAVATRPGVIISPKVDGYVEVMCKGMETDWNGAGKTLYVIPTIYCAQDANGDPATNLLVNPSFDTYTGATGIADSWTMSGTQGGMTFDVGEDDPAPPAIFGKRQRVYVAGAGSTAYLTQAPSVTYDAGDRISSGVWHRAKLDSGASLAGEPGYYVRLQAGGVSVKDYVPAGDNDWQFLTQTAWTLSSGTSASIQLVSYDALGYEVRWDEAFLFKGTWAIFPMDTYRIRVKGRARPSKTNFASTNSFIAGTGGFNVDTDGSGVADGWRMTGGTNTYSIERDPDHLNTVISPTSWGAQKVVLNGAASDRLRLVYRGNFLAGEDWRFTVYYKNSGALSGSPANGDFGPVLHTEEFDGPYESSSMTGANFNTTSTTSYTAKARQLILTSDHSVLICDINLNTASGGTLWIDSASLRRGA